MIWFQGNINFITMAPGVDFTTYDQSDSNVYPKSGANTYLLSDILELGNIDYEEIKITGGVIRIKIAWDCSITWSNSCSPKIESKRLDDISGVPIGFAFDRYFYYTENGEKYRDYLNTTGIRIVVESSGRAYAVTLNSIILNVSSALNLTMLTPRIVDFLMIYVMKNRADYRKSKYVYTKDLNNENFDAINEDLPIESADNTNNLETDNIRNLP